MRRPPPLRRVLSFGSDCPIDEDPAPVFTGVAACRRDADTAQKRGGARKHRPSHTTPETGGNMVRCGMFQRTCRAPGLDPVIYLLILHHDTSAAIPSAVFLRTGTNSHAWFRDNRWVGA